MAQYILTDPIIKTVDANKQNAGKKYLVGKLTNSRCVWDAPQTFTCFIDHIVEAFAQLLPVTKGGVAQQEQAIPDVYKTIYGCWLPWVAPAPFYKQHLSDHPARPATATSAAREAIRAGSLVKRGGTPIVYTTLTIFCQYYIDEDGNKQWLRGQSPEEIGMQNYLAYCIPVSQDNSPQDVTQGGQPPVENIGGQNYQTVAPPNNNTGGQPAQQQQQPQFMQGPAQSPGMIQ